MFWFVTTEGIKINSQFLTLNWIKLL